MTRFNDYAKRLDKIAREAFEAYRKAEKAYKDAEAKARQYPKRNGFVDAQYVAKSACAQADFLAAKEAYNSAKRAFADTATQFTPIRKELAAAIDDAYSADPSALDMATLELLKSGILTGAEYVKLLRGAQDANNPTMVRLIGHYAGEAAQARAESHGMHDPDVSAMRIAQNESRTYTGGDRLEAFDNMVSLYERCIRNPSMIDHWDRFTAETVEKF